MFPDQHSIFEVDILDSYVLFALVVIAFWLVSFLIYIVISNRQRDIEGEILQVNRMLDDDSRESAGF